MEIIKEIRMLLFLMWSVVVWMGDVAISFVWVLFISTLQFFAVSLPLSLLGLFLVPIGILRPDDSKKAETFVIVNGKEWWLRTFKDKWLKWWDNPIDGTFGDDNLRWGGRDIDFGVSHMSFLGQYMWCAIRNPLHYFKQFIMCCDIRNCVYEHLIGSLYVRDNLGGRGFQLARAKNTKGFFNYYRLYWVAKWPFCNRGVIVEMGYEFRKDHWDLNYEGSEYKNYKGFAWIISPFKLLR
jgi:hypothetical protein